MKKIKLLLAGLLLACAFTKAQTYTTIIPCGFDVSKIASGNTGLKPLGSVNYVNTAFGSFSASAIYNCGNFRVYYEDIQQGLSGGFNDPVLGSVRRNTLCAVLNYIQSVFALGTNTLDLYVDLSYCSANSAPANTTWAGRGGPYSRPGTLGTGAGFFGGDLYDHIITGIDPDPTNFDARVVMNFDLVTPANSIPIEYWDDYTNTSASCKIDLFSVLLHELTHCLGWYSALGQGPLPNNFLINAVNSSGLGTFSKLDEFFLYKGDPRFLGFNKLVLNTTPPAINSGLATTPNVLANSTNSNNTNSIWTTNNPAPNNCKVYDNYYPNSGAGTAVCLNITYQVFPASFLSHLDNGNLAMYRGGQHSPGFQPKYVMGYSAMLNQKVREYSIQELRMLCTMGYALNPTFATSSSMVSNTATTNAALTFSNQPPYRNNTATNFLVRFPLFTTVEQGVAFMDAENKPADYSVVNTTPPSGVPVPLLTIDVSTITTISDPNNDPIGVLPNSLFGIRGVTTGGNNHNSIAITNSHTIVYSPPPGYYGRAEFGFNLWDGKEKGGVKIITIDVLPGAWPLLAPGSELLINGSFEDGTEVKTLSDQTKATSTRLDGHVTALNYTSLLAGAHPYYPWLTGGAGDGNGLIKKESGKYCWGIPSTYTPSVGSNIPYEGFGSIENTAQSWPLYASAANPMPVNVPSNINENYAVTTGGSPTSGRSAPIISYLYNSLQTCGYYRLEFDASAPYNYPLGFTQNFNLAAINNLSNVATLGNSNILYNTLQNIPVQFTVSAISTVSNNLNWQHVVCDFVYCGPATSTVLLEGVYQPSFNILSNTSYIDNISLKEKTTPPPPLIVTATNSSTLFCPGGTFTLTGNAVNSSCSTNFTWQPMNFVSPTVMVTPPTPTTTYTLFANDGCRTGSAVVTPAPLPGGTFTAGPVCIGQTSTYDLESITPATVTLPNGYAGPALSWSVNSVTGGISAYINLTAPNNTVLPGVYNYTCTHYLPAGCFETYTFDVTFLGTPTVVATPSCILPGQSATITALPSTWNYTWMPTSITSSSFVITPTGSVTYDLLYDNGVCSALIPKNAIVTVMTPVTFTNLPVTWCNNSAVYNLNGFLAPGVPTNGQWFSAGTSPLASFTNSSGINFSISPAVAAGVYTINYIYSPVTNTNCSTFGSFTVNIIPNFSLAASGPSLYCSNLGLGAQLNAIVSTTNAVTFTWQPGSLSGATPTAFPTSPTTYTVEANDGTCSRNTTLAIAIQTNCCSGNVSSPMGNINSGNIGANGITTPINQNITITGSVNLVGDIRIASGVSITIANGGTLTIFDKAGAHLYACGDMWHGIIVNNSGQLNAVAGNVLIEDAKEAVSISNANISTTNPANYNLRLNNVVFNRNLRGIVIRNSLNISPYDIRKCVFTCRNYTSNVTNWVSSVSLFIPGTPTNAMASPYLMLNAPPANLKPPGNLNPLTVGVMIENSGVSAGVLTPFPNYLHVIVGDNNGGGTTNLFDQLIFGIYSINSNAASYNNIFQNSASILPAYPGCGIRSVNTFTNSYNYTSSLDMVSPVSPSVDVNHFYDCVFGVNASELFHFNMQYSEFQSSQSSSLTFAPYNPGYCGVFIKTGSFDDHNISFNKFMNLNNGVYYGFSPGTLNMTSPPSYGIFWGNVKINKNLFCPDLSPISFANTFGFMNSAVILDNPMNTSPTNSGLLTRSIEVNNNGMYRVQNGISSTGFWKGTTVVNTYSNYISLTPNLTNTKQIGIRNYYNVASSANMNTVLGFTIPINNNFTGLYSNFNINLSTRCNSVSMVANGFEFEGLNQATKWANNVMVNSYTGMRLSTNGVINTQGGNTNPSDNYWQGTNWNLPPYNNTFNDNSQVINSKLFVRNGVPTGGYYPTNNSSTPSGMAYTNIPGSLLVSTAPGPLSGCIPPFTAARMDTVDHGYLDSLAVNLYPYMVYQSETEEINQELLFANLAQDCPLRLSTPTLSAFYYGNVTSALGLLNKIERNFSNGNITYANSLLASFTPTSNIQNNYKMYYKIYNTFITQGYLSMGDSLNLDLLARKCPLIDGVSVYKARALNNIIYQRLELYDDNYCLPGEELNSTGEARMMMTTTGEANGSKYIRQLNMRYQIYPNPAVDEIFITSNRQTETLHVIIRDVNSKVMYDENVLIENYENNIKPNLINGVYFMSIENSRQEKLVKKLIISK